MTLQTSVEIYQGAGFRGQWYDISDTEVVSLTAEGSHIPFGVAVVLGGHDNQCRLPDHGGYLATVGGPAATDPDVNKFAGLAMYHTTTPTDNDEQLSLPIGDGDRGFLREKEVASCATHGRFYVVAETDVAKGDPVFFRHTLADNAASPQTQQLGMLRNDDDGGTAIQIAGAEFMHSSIAGELTIVKLTGAVQA